MISARASRWQLIAGMVLLVFLHFFLRPRLGSPRSGPDFLFIALMFYAMRSGPGAGAAAGFAVGLIQDALTPAQFGAGALAHTVVGYLAAWGRAVFFADNLVVNAAFVAVGVWLRDVIVLVASGPGEENLFLELTLRSPLQALVSGLAAAVVLVVFRQWFSIRLDA
jgi:rod shape-determining protein MreD